MIGRLRTVVLDAADMDAESKFWSAVLDLEVVHRSHDWTTLEGHGVRLAVQLAPTTHSRTGRTRPARSSSISTSRWTTSNGPSSRCWGSALAGCPTRRTPWTSACTPTLPVTRSAWSSTSEPPGPRQPRKVNSGGPSGTNAVCGPA